MERASRRWSGFGVGGGGNDERKTLACQPRDSTNKAKRDSRQTLTFFCQSLIFCIAFFHQPAQDSPLVPRVDGSRTPASEKFFWRLMTTLFHHLVKELDEWKRVAVQG